MNRNLHSLTHSGTLSRRQIASEQLALRRQYEEIIYTARASGDILGYSKKEDKRELLSQIISKIFLSVAASDRPLKNTAAILRSRHPDRAQQNVNPARIAAAAQPALTAGLISKDQIRLLTDIARRGICIQEIRDLLGPSLDLMVGNASSPEDHAVLLDFYYEQAFRGRVLAFPPQRVNDLDSLGELILSPSFLVKAPGKKPRCILNMSSTDHGVNQRVAEMPNSCRANKDGYCTVPDIAKMIVTLFVRMVTRPSEFNIEDILNIELAMIAMDGDAAFSDGLYPTRQWASKEPGWQATPLFL